MEKTLPCSISAEEGLLGSLIIDPEAITQVADFVHAGDFYRDAHRTIYAVMTDLCRRDAPADFITICDELERDNKLESVGGASYITSLINQVPTSSNVEYYGHIVERTAILRRLILAAGHIAATAYEQADANAALDQAESLIAAIRNRATPRDAVDVETLALDTLSRLSALRHRPRGTLVGVPSGFTQIDFLTGGWQRGDLIIVAGRPSMGKSAFMLSMAYHAAMRKQKRILIFSLEMSKESLMNRLVAMDAHVDSQMLRLGRLTADEWDRVDMALGRLSELGDLILIDDTQGLTPIEMRSRARRHHAKHPLDIIMVDYLQRMKAEKNGKRISDPTEEVGEISTELKSLAIEMDIPVLALAQLNRDVEHRQDKRPQLSDLAQSGRIEQDADLILFLYRDEYYNKATMRPGIADILIAKHRNGPLDEVALHYAAKYTQFSNMESER